MALPRIPLPGQFEQYRPQFGNVLADLGYGLSQGGFKKGFGYAGQRAAEMAPYRQQMAEEEQQRNQTVEWLKQKAQSDPRFAELVAGLEAGVVDPGDAFTTGMGYLNEQGPEPTANMRDFEYAQQNPGYADFLNPPDQANQPAMVQEYEYAKQGGYTGSFMDYQRDSNSRATAPMDATTKKELFEAQEAATAGDYVLSALDRALELNATAVDGPYAGERAYAGSMIPDMGVANGNEQDYATLEFQNITTELALTQLKTIFGSMPTEGERKILIELQGSVDKPRAVRKNILQRAKQMAQRRIDDANAKAEALRSGGYFQPGYGQQPAAPTGTAGPANIPFTIEP